MTRSRRSPARRGGIALVIYAAFLASCSGTPTEPTPGPATPLTLNLRSAAWETLSDPQPYPLSNDAETRLTLDFPTTGSINYLFTTSPQAQIRGTLVATVRVTTIGPVIFNSLDPITGACAIPASVRPFIWANANGNGDYDRWWANPTAAPLASGSATISVPFSPESWSSVNGKKGNESTATKYGFEKAMLNVSRLGLTFGGGCSFGHGINVSGGQAQFVLAEYAVR